MVVNSQFDRAALFGNLDANIKLIEEHFGVEITERGSELIVGGEKAQEAEKVISELIKVLDSGEAIDTQKINYIIGLTEQGISYRESDISKDILCFTHIGCFHESEYFNCFFSGDRRDSCLKVFKNLFKKRFITLVTSCGYCSF